MHSRNSTLLVQVKVYIIKQQAKASNPEIPTHSKNEDFHAAIATKPFADQRGCHHGTYCIIKVY